MALWIAHRELTSNIHYNRPANQNAPKSTSEETIIMMNEISIIIIL